MGKNACKKGIILLFSIFFFRFIGELFQRDSRRLLDFSLVFAIVLFLFVQIPYAFSAQLTLGWNENPEDNIGGYKLHYGTQTGVYTNIVDVGLETTHTLSNLQEGETYYFAVTAYNVFLVGSSYSDELIHTIYLPNSSPSTPSTPSGPFNGYINMSYNFSTSSSDPDGDPLTFQFDWGDGTTSSWGSSAWSHSWASAGNYCVKAMAKDSHGATSDWSNCLDISITENSAPVANAGADQTVQVNDSVTLDASGSSDADGDSLTYAWSFVSKPDGSAAALSDTSGAKPVFTVDAAGSYVLQLIVNDGSVNSQPDTVTVSTENSAPVANAGADQTVEAGDMVTLSGADSFDHDNNISSYSWNQTNGPAVGLSTANETDATFTAPNADANDLTLTFQLTVKDSEGLSDVDTCVIYITKAGIPDRDNDGIPDDQDAFPDDPNEWVDTDKDGIGNNSDEDDDNDTLPDEWEIQYGLNPLVNDASEDADLDGISNLDEYLAGTDPIVPEGNSNPDAPELMSPSNQALVTVLPLLKTGDFYDRNAGDVHTETHWQIIRQNDGLTVLDVKTLNSLTSLQVPNHILDGATTYQWTARFYDNHGAASEWSQFAVFSTESNSEDLDNNGIPDHQEVVDALSDIDNDGIPDANEDTIKCVVTNGGDTTMGVSFEGSNTVVAIESLTSEDPNLPVYAGDRSNLPEYFPFGIISFKLAVANPGDEAEVTVYLSGPAPDESIWYKYDPIEGLWFDFSGNTIFSSDRQSVKLFLKDGGPGDADGIENSLIVDPSGVGATSLSGALDGVNSNNASCFIDSVASGSSQYRQSLLSGNRLIHFFTILLLIMAKAVIAYSISMKIRQKHKCRQHFSR
jgi:hypothetical protein